MQYNTKFEPLSLLRLLSYRIVILSRFPIQQAQKTDEETIVEVQIDGVKKWHLLFRVISNCLNFSAYFQYV